MAKQPKHRRVEQRKSLHPGLGVAAFVAVSLFLSGAVFAQSRVNVEAARASSGGVSVTAGLFASSSPSANSAASSTGSTAGANGSTGSSAGSNAGANTGSGSLLANRVGSLENRIMSACESVMTSSKAPEGKSDVLGEKPEIVCWGDSLTEGIGATKTGRITLSNGTQFDASFLSYPQVLNKLTGYATCNFGVAGATSEEIAVMQGGLEPLGDIAEYRFTSSEVSKLGKSHPGTVLVIEMGSNGGWDNDFDLLIEQYQAMIDHSGCSNYIIIGDTDDPGTSAADFFPWYQDESDSYNGSYDWSRYGIGAVNTVNGEDASEVVGENVEGDNGEDAGEDGDEGSNENVPVDTVMLETPWERALHEAFGGHFINMRRYIVEHGLALTGLEPTEEDLEYAENGCVSPQLRTDWTHMNSYGYFVQAMGVYERGVELGYW